MEFKSNLEFFLIFLFILSVQTFDIDNCPKKNIDFCETKKLQCCTKASVGTNPKIPNSELWKTELSEP